MLTHLSSGHVSLLRGEFPSPIFFNHSLQFAAPGGLTMGFAAFAAIFFSSKFFRNATSLPRGRANEPILVPTCLYYLTCTKFVQLILSKIINTVAIRCRILSLK